MPSREYVEEVSERGSRRTRQEPGGLLRKRQAMIEEQLGRLDNELDRLAERLGPVLGPERPSAVLAAGGSADDPGSDLGRALEHYSGRIDALTARLSELTDRLDL